MQREAASRDKIVKISARLFAENGFHNTGVAELSKAVGRGRGALYHHIESKESLLYEICTVQVDEATVAAERILESSLPSTEKLTLLARGLLRNISDHLDEWTVFFREFAALTGERFAEVATKRARYEEIWLKTWREGFEAGELRGGDPILIKGILGMFNYSYLWMRPAGKMAPEAVADMFIDVLLNGLTTVQRHPIAQISSETELVD